MSPGKLCIHYFPSLRTSCDAGLRAPRDCHGCPAYYDGTPYLGMTDVDTQRERLWAQAFSTPQAHFRQAPSGHMTIED
jgi:hypothetical protein